MQAYNKYLVLVSTALCLTIVILHNILAKKIFKTFMNTQIISTFKLAQPDLKNGNRQLEQSLEAKQSQEAILSLMTSMSQK